MPASRKKISAFEACLRGDDWETNAMMSSAELIPANLFERFDFREIFGREAPVEIDLGCGDGTFLAEIAGRIVAHDFIGVERLRGRVRSARGKIESRGLSNARILREETRYVVERLIPPASVHRFHLLFPDPWPKRRHQRRRIVTPRFLASIVAALRDDGVLHFATDQRDYFDATLRIANISGAIRIDDADCDFPTTTFERHFRLRGIGIHRALMRKISPVIKARASHPESRIVSSIAPVSS